MVLHSTAEGAFGGSHAKLQFEIDLEISLAPRHFAAAAQGKSLRQRAHPVVHDGGDCGLRCSGVFVCAHVYLWSNIDKHEHIDGVNTKSY